MPPKRKTASQAHAASKKAKQAPPSQPLAAEITTQRRTSSRLRRGEPSKLAAEPVVMQPREAEILPTPASAEQRAASSPEPSDVDEFEMEAEQPGRDQRILHSTTIPVGSNIFSEYAHVDSTARLASVLEQTLSAVRDASLGAGNSRLINRLTTAKDLPTFSGDPLEWLHFKESYNLSSETGEYSERENITRLFKALKGEAREVVSTLLASSQDSAAIIRTLELHFGNKRVVAEKIMSDLRKLPDLESGKITIIQFATKLRNAVIAFKKFKLNGYLYSPDLIKAIGNKLPSALKYAYNRFVANSDNEKSDLEKLSDFIYSEAELAASAGIFDLNFMTDTTEKSQSKTNDATYKRPRPAKAAAVCTAKHVSTPSGHVAGRAGDNNECLFCARKNHKIGDCRLFSRTAVKERWNFVKNQRLCFRCLKSGHRRENCTSTVVCVTCKAPHSTLLHFEKVNHVSRPKDTSNEKYSNTVAVSNNVNNID